MINGWLAQAPLLVPHELIAAVLFCAGLAIGLTLGKRAARRFLDGEQMNSRYLSGLLAHLLDWTHGMADDMNEYRSVVSGLAQVFRSQPQPFADQQRDTTLALLGQVVEANEQLQDRLNTAERTLIEQASEMSQHMTEARTDPLTGLPNRRALEEDLTHQVAQWHAHGRPWSVLMIDVDLFKKLNDAHGHAAGDAALQQVADLLRQTMRHSDLVVRIGGEEMVVVLPGTVGEQACEAAERLRGAIEHSEFTHGEESLGVTVSVGAAQCQSDEEPAQLLRRADEALYAAKQAGRNRAFWHNGRCPAPIVGEGRPEQARGELAGVSRAAGEKERCVSEPDLGFSGQAKESFAAVCQDLRRRLEEFTGGTAP